MFEGEWAFVIDTDQYAGNFERDICAFVTGHVGECGVGEEFAEIFKEEVGNPIENVTREPDEHGCCRPTSMYYQWHPSHEQFEYTSVAIFFDCRPKQAQINLMKERALLFTKCHLLNVGYPKNLKKLQITGFRLLHQCRQITETVV